MTIHIHCINLQLVHSLPVGLIAKRMADLISSTLSIGGSRHLVTFQGEHVFHEFLHFFCVLAKCGMIFCFFEVSMVRISWWDGKGRRLCLPVTHCVWISGNPWFALFLLLSQILSINDLEWAKFAGFRGRFNNRWKANYPSEGTSLGLKIKSVVRKQWLRIISNFFYFCQIGW